MIFVKIVNQVSSYPVNNAMHFTEGGTRKFTMASLFYLSLSFQNQVKPNSCKIKQPSLRQSHNKAIIETFPARQTSHPGRDHTMRKVCSLCKVLLIAFDCLGGDELVSSLNNFIEIIRDPEAIAMSHDVPPSIMVIIHVIEQHHVFIVCTSLGSMAALAIRWFVHSAIT
jgi:hypothetical protein